jgi:hypothetical protein
MKPAYVITEGETEVKILQKLLPQSMEKNIQFVAGSRDSVDSLSNSILGSKRVPVAIIVDANTDDELLIYEHQDFLHYSLNQVAGRVPFKILFAVPAIETIFFQDQALLEKRVNHKFTPLEWEFAQYHPKKSLTYFLGDNPLSVLLTNLTDQAIAVWQQHPFITELVEFLSSVIDNKTVTDNL